MVILLRYLEAQGRAQALRHLLADAMQKLDLSSIGL